MKYICTINFKTTSDNSYALTLTPPNVVQCSKANASISLTTYFTLKYTENEWTDSTMDQCFKLSWHSINTIHFQRRILK